MIYSNHLSAGPRIDATRIARLGAQRAAQGPHDECTRGAGSRRCRGDHQAVSPAIISIITLRVPTRRLQSAGLARPLDVGGRHGTDGGDFVQLEAVHLGKKKVAGGVISVADPTAVLVSISTVAHT